MPEQATDDILHVLRQTWGHTRFRPLQEDIIRAVLAGHDTLALLPTGGGKSICFQVPALAGRDCAWWCRR
ncbi:DEAD/DEAH box helicase [Hymenobacter lapidiphilus]|uniref:DEAD/DEAH box helicase n=1 Tax=Hymenobacter sp. CCM 8763 TaxID=2303334 RepID=UPI001F5BC8C7|nr:DEAD/DEAH box helicase [Hymenobacter sp. CCM 8763]